eukprot:4106748-Pyramimonas_sp.AAC.1
MASAQPPSSPGTPAAAPPVTAAPDAERWPLPAAALARALLPSAAPRPSAPPATSAMRLIT